MPICVVKNCPNSENGQKSSEIGEKTDTHFFCLPQNYSDRIKWEKFSGRKFQGLFPEHAVLCERHFHPESIVEVNGR